MIIGFVIRCFLRYCNIDKEEGLLIGIISFCWIWKQVRKSGLLWRIPDVFFRFRPEVWTQDKNDF